MPQCTIYLKKDNMERRYTVYEHVSPENKRYIGITSQKTSVRWRKGNGYSKNKHFFRAIQKYGWENFQHNIIAENVEENEAKIKEVELIKKYNTTNPKFGYNITRGGDTRQPCPEEVRERIRQKTKGKIVSEETRRKISLAKKGVKKPPMSDEQKSKISISLLGNKRALGKHNNTKPIAMCDLNGNILRNFSSAVEVQKELNLSSSAIDKACRENADTNGLENTKYGGIYGGHKWYFIDDNGAIINNNTGKKINKRNTSIIQCDLDGNILQRFEKIKEATKHCGFPINGLGFALKDKASAEYGGFLWVKEY